ncbi:LiaI-LiaF-like domain-containing protein [Cytobacillus sp. FJAT-54145]|uniref:LiaI-LiaF-like domain-containing protein n=1 Tax=Cytobacillus spartinae TaxID=3299023 RepID=A0ABW6KKL5_9BACI
MKNQRIFPGIILIGFGAYFFLQQSQISLFKEFYTWPTLLIIVGIAFLFQGYLARDYEAILPGVILSGFGLHFHVVDRLQIWPNHIGTFILIIALGFLLRYQKVGAGLFQGMLFLVLAILLLFYDKITQWLGLLENGVSLAWKFWPAALVIIGIYLLIRKK